MKRSSPRTASSTPCSGFTLVEMVMVLTMIGVLATVSIPLAFRDDPAARTREDAQQLSDVLRQARFRAVAMKRDVYVHFEPAGSDEFYTAYVNLGDPGDVPTGTNEEIAASRIPFSDLVAGTRGSALETGVRFQLGSASSDPQGNAATTAIDLPENPLVFQPKGTVRWTDSFGESTGTIFLAHDVAPEAVKAITVGRTGTVRLWRFRNGDWE